TGGGQDNWPRSRPGERTRRSTPAPKTRQPRRPTRTQRPALARGMSGVARAAPARGTPRTTPEHAGGREGVGRETQDSHAERLARPPALSQADLAAGRARV